MPPKKKDLAAEKAKRQKKILIGLIVVFIPVMWFMLIPTLTKKPPGPPAASGATPATTATTPGVTPPTDTTVAPATGNVSAGSVAAPSYSFSASDSQLKRFSGSLKSKDPFAGTPAITDAASTTPIVAPTPPVIPPDGSTPGSGGTSTTPGGASSPYVYAVLSVNGLAEGVALNAPFPAASPLFSLVAVGSRWVQFSLVTGTFANGAKRVTLMKGRKLTLRNTADGSVFVIQLVTVSKAIPTAPATTTQTSTSVLLTPDTTPAATPTTTSTTPPPPTTPTS
jgi:hypothetical protein